MDVDGEDKLNGQSEDDVEDGWRWRRTLWSPIKGEAGIFRPVTVVLYINLRLVVMQYKCIFRNVFIFKCLMPSYFFHFII